MTSRPRNQDLLPVVWSEVGPVIDVGVEPLCLVQSKTSVVN